MFDYPQFRWSTAAEDVCFKGSFSSFCMAVGKVLPLHRGSGVYQKTMNFCVNELQAGKWVHIFPEGMFVSKSHEEVLSLFMYIFQSLFNTDIGHIWVVDPPYQLSRIQL
jgi:1-acyl-sn-glycerol-3-phosphate acyltransferase